MVAEALSRWAVDVRWSALPEADRTRVVDTLVDTVGVTLAGAADIDMEPVWAAASDLGWTAAGSVELWGRDEHVSAASAALLNATAAHVLDFDDIHTVLHGHPSAVLWPAIIAVAQEDGVADERLFDAYLAGLGVMDAVATLFGPRHYSVGWHSTATVGTIGAAVAAAVVAGLDAARVKDVIGVSVSMAQGVRANFGSILKPLHAGLAARSAVEALRLVQAGARPADDPLTAQHGALDVFGDGSLASDVPAEHWPDLMVARADRAMDALGTKAWPACRGAHYAIDAAHEVHRSLRAQTDSPVVAARVEVPLGARTALLHDDPSTGLQARFSLPYTVAATLVHGWPGLTHFTDTAVADPSVRAVMRVLEVNEDDTAGDLSSTMQGRYAVVWASTGDGHEAVARCDDARGSVTRPLTSAEVDAKFVATAVRALPEDRVRELLAALRGPVPSFGT